MGASRQRPYSISSATKSIQQRNIPNGSNHHLLILKTRPLHQRNAKAARAVHLHPKKRSPERIQRQPITTLARWGGGSYWSWSWQQLPSVFSQGIIGIWRCCFWYFPSPVWSLPCFSVKKAFSLCSSVRNTSSRSAFSRSLTSRIWSLWTPYSLGRSGRSYWLVSPLVPRQFSALALHWSFLWSLAGSANCFPDSLQAASKTVPLSVCIIRILPQSIGKTDRAVKMLTYKDLYHYI